MSHTYILAEAGVNHNGDPKLAFELLEAAAAAGVDGIKFQTFKASSLVTETAEMADYQVANTGKTESQHEMLSRLELGFETYTELAARAKTLGVDFLSTAFDSDSLAFLTQNLGVNRLKIASGELTNAPFVLEHARTHKPIILSTGMATLAEIESALSVLAFGWSQADTAVPSAASLTSAFADPKMQQLLQDRVTLLHCTTEYPTPPADVNLAAMDTLRAAFHLTVGYSDHTSGNTIPTAAVARGATMIEKHFTLSREMEGPDHAASLEPNELKDMTAAIRLVEAAIGSGIKAPCASELDIMLVARKSLVASAAIAKGDPVWCQAAVTTHSHRRQLPTTTLAKASILRLLSVPQTLPLARSTTSVAATNFQPRPGSPVAAPSTIWPRSAMRT